MTIIHGCWLEDDDIQLMAERDVRLVYNPASNMFLGDGVTRIVDMLAAGVKHRAGQRRRLLEQSRLGLRRDAHVRAACRR